MENDIKTSLRDLRLERPVTDDVIFYFLSSVDSPRSLSIWLLYKAKQFDDLIDLDCDPLHYNNAEDFRNSYLATQFLSKSKFLPLNRDRKQLALDKFWESEQKNRDTNRKWKRRNEFSRYDWHHISCVANKIFSILGSDPDYEEFINQSSWGPGASLRIKRRDASSYKKFHSECGITVDAYDTVPFISKFYPLLSERIYCVENGDRVVVVPKNSKIDRVILIQPGWNLWFQKGIGKQIRSRLRSCGLDLNLAPERNTDLCYRSSKSGRLATVDFSSASDQIAIEPVREVLPPGWFRLLDQFRSKRSFDSAHTWEKFSSMGNGFTFELESLIFYSIALTSCEVLGVDDSEVSVFGDDVILPVEALELFHSISDLFGFTFNSKKTFSSGYFRESCGSHFFNGVDCKPVFLKEKISDVQGVFKVYNAIRRLSHRRMNKLACDGIFERCCSFIRGLIPVRYRFRIPDGFGDVGFVSNFDEATPSRFKHSLSGYSFRALIDVPLNLESEEPAILMVRLTEHSDVSRGNSYEIKARTRRKIKNLHTLEWYNLGPWIRA